MQYKPLNTNIDYLKIADALIFYQELGYKLIEVPWVISEEAERITGHPHPRCTSFLGDHVASAEQSFLELILRKELPEGKYVACTPCFRNDNCDEIHHKWFIKVELINFLGYKTIPSDKAAILTDQIIQDAMLFYKRYTEIGLLKTDIGMDITAKDIELGSYGYREHNDFSWIYGTGIAEPRLSYVLNLQKRGYHEKDIPKGVIGEVSKIKEEFYELMDAHLSDNKIMELWELTDLIGAIELYIENRFKGTVKLKDLLTTSDTTKRAFLNGRRI